MELKDTLTILFSVLALAFSIIALIQKNSETKRMIRGLIADAISKLISTETEIRRITSEIRANEDNTHLRSIRNALVQQREAIAQQALYLIPQVADRFVTAVDYATLARALATDDADLADCYWNKAINTSRAISQGKHTRSYAQFLFSQQKYEKGRATFKKATELLEAPDDNHRWERMYAFLNWAESEARAPGAAEARSHEVEQHMRSARNTCVQIEDQSRREGGLKRIKEQKENLPKVAN